MKQRYKTIMTIVSWTIRSATIVFIVSFIVLAVESQTQKMSVTVTIEPQRVIIVDKNFTIIQIISNTENDVRPTVFLTSQDGEEIPYSDSIRLQYMYLKSTINFAEPGIVYDRDDQSPIALIKLIIRVTKKLMDFPF